MGQHPAVRDTLTKGVSSGEGLTSAYDTIVRSKDPTVKPGQRKFSLADRMTPELREEFVKSFDAQFGEGAAEAMFKTHDQMHIKKSRLCQCTCDHGQPLRITDSHISI